MRGLKKGDLVHLKLSSRRTQFAKGNDGNPIQFVIVERNRKYGQIRTEENHERGIQNQDFMDVDLTRLEVIRKCAYCGEHISSNTDDRFCSAWCRQIFEDAVKREIPNLSDSKLIVLTRKMGVLPRA